MDQIGTSVAADAINKLIVAPLIQQIDDVIHLNRNRGVLRGKLESMKLLLQNICNGFQNQQRTPPESIRHCLESTRDAIEEAKSLIDRFQPQQWCLDCIFCEPRISRQIREWNSRFDQLHQELLTLFLMFESAHQIGSSSAQPAAKELLQPLPDWGIVAMDIKSAETQLQTWLTEASQLRIIGVYGMARVGKTTLLKSVYNFYKASDVFDVVIWVTVSKDYKISDLQGHIAKALKLDLSDISGLDNDTRKMALSASLIKKNFLLMLDDMWSPLDLQQELGVQFGVDKASKVVFSTRSRNLALTEAQKALKVKPLSTEEGRELFQRVAFKDGHVPEELKECARDFADECEGFPLAITVVAAAMRGKKSLHEWNTCLSLMKNADASFPNTHPRVDQQLYRQLRWSYDDLSKTPNLQNCFLYCAMYPENQQIDVEKLVLMWIAEGFVKSKDATHSKDMDLGRRYVKILLDRGLFQSVNFEKQSKDIIVNKSVDVWKRRYITVHNVIRDIAIYIGEEENYLCHAGQQLQDFPDSQTQANCKRISVCLNEIKSLPNRDFQCPKLVSLLLSKNPLSCNVPESFLINLTSLRVLDLSYTRIESVPTSLTQLALLNFLDLSVTAIKELPEGLGKLTQLQYLNLYNCQKLVSVPSSIGELTQLQYLNLGDCLMLVSLPCSIGKLKQLQYMDLWYCPQLVLPPELSQVTSLRRLDLFIILNMDSLIMDNWSEMKHLKLYYDTNHDLPRKIQNMKKLQSFKLVYKGVNFPNWTYEFQQLERLELLHCSEVEEVPLLERLPNLKFLKLAACNKMKDLGIGSSRDPRFPMLWTSRDCTGFPMLEILVLKNMGMLQSLTWPLCEGVMLKEGTLSKLRVLKILQCPILRKLPIGMEKLPSLIALYGEERWWENMIWEDDNMKIYLDKVFKSKERYTEQMYNLYV